MRLRPPGVLNRSRSQKGQAELGIIAVLVLSALVLFMLYLGLPLNLVIISILGFLVFIVAFINTDIALIILILSMLLSPEFAVGKVTGRAVIIRAEDLILLLAFSGWIAKMAINKELGLFRSTPLNTPIFFLIVIYLLSSFLGIASGRINMRDSAFYILKYVEYFMLFFMVSNNLKSMAQVRKFIFFFLLTCLIVCIFSITHLEAGRATAPFEGGEGGEPNTFAGYLILMMTLILGLILYPDTPGKRLVHLGLLGLSGVAFLMTLSRGGWISFFPAILTFVFLTKAYRPHLVILIILGAMILPMMAPKSVQKRAKDTFVTWKTYKVLEGKIGVDESTAARIDSWAVGIERWSRAPVFGYGIPAGVVIDNQFTRVLNETGAIGFAIFVWMLFALFRVGWRAFQETAGSQLSQGISLGYLAGFMGLLLMSASTATFIIIRIMEPFWFLTAIVTVLPDIQGIDSLPPQPQKA